jgi:hypothetical protein
MPKAKHPYVVVRTYSAGVECGELVSHKGKEVVLANARKIWRWFGANTLHEVANNGVAAESKISEPVSQNTLTEAIEVIRCTPKGEASLRAAVWAK